MDRLTGIILILTLAATAGCLRGASARGAWIEMETRQIAVPLGAGPVTVQIFDAVDGWTDSFEVERRPTGELSGLAGIEVELDDPSEAGSDAEDLATIAAPALAAARTDLERATALSYWFGERAFARRAQAVDAGRELDDPVAAENGREALAAVDATGAFNCLTLATILADAARATGLQARRVDLSLRHGSPYEGHSVVEVWCREIERWVLVDPTFATTYEVDGAPAGARELHRAVIAGRIDAIRVIRPEGAASADPWTHDINPLLYFRNVYLKNAGGQPYLVLADSPDFIAPVAWRGFVQTDSDAAWTAGPDERIVAVPLYEAGRRVTAQVLGNTLYVCLREGLFVPERFRVTVSGAEPAGFTPDLRAHDLSDPLLAAPGELGPEPRAWDAAGGGLPNGWTLQGTPALLEPLPGGGAVVEAGNEDVVITVSARVPDGEPLVAAARVRVKQGRAGVSLRKAPKNYTWVSPGATCEVSPFVAVPGKRVAGLRILLEPGTRIRIESVSIRRARRLMELGAARG